MASSPLLRDIVYSDVSITFTPHPVTGRLPVLFENAVDGSFQAILKKRIELAIRNHEPRVKVQNVSVNTVTDSHTCFITIVFSILNERDQQSLTLTLDRVR